MTKTLDFQRTNDIKRKRTVRDSNGLLQSALNHSLKRGSTLKIREVIARNAYATPRTEEDGRQGMLTYGTSFKKTVPPAAVFDQIGDAYSSLHSFEGGSLSRLLLCIHALGFRVFKKASLASQFTLSGKVANEEHVLAESLSGNQLNFRNLTYTQLYNSLTTGFRGKGDDVSRDPILARLSNELLDKPYGSLSESIEKSFIDKVADNLDSTYDKWKDLTSDIEGSSEIVSKILNDLGVATSGFPKVIEVLKASNDTESSLKKSTLVFDPSAHTFSNELSSSDLLIALAARYAQEAVKYEIKPAGYIKESITTTNGNGLKWLFGAIFGPIQEASPEDLRHSLNIDRKSDQFKILSQLASEFSEPEIFTRSVIKDCISTLQGSIDSFLSNHYNRLESTYKSLCDSPVSNIVETISPYLEHEGISQNPNFIDAKHRLENYEKIVKSGLDGAATLLGLNDKSLDDDIILEAIESHNALVSYLRYLDSLVNTINNIINKSGLKLDKIDVSFPSDLSLTSSFGATITDPVEDRRATQAELDRLTFAYQAAFDKLVKGFDLTFDKALLEQQKKYEYPCKLTKRTALKSPQVVAYRDFLARLTSTIYRGSDKFQRSSIAILKKSGIFQDARQLVEHLTLRRHYTFVSPYDTKVKKLVALKDSAQDINLLDVVDRISEAEMEDRDHINLFLLRTSIELSGLPEVIPSSWLIDNFKTEHLDALFGKEYADLFIRNTKVISRGSLIASLTKNYSSSISGHNYRLNKKRFVIRQTLFPYTSPQLVYVPKDKGWRVPKQMLEGYFEPIFNSDNAVWKEDGVLDVRATCRELTKTKSLSSKTLSFLKELPHSFYLQSDIKGWGQQRFGIAINASKIEKSGDFNSLVPLSIDKNNFKIHKLFENLFNGAKLSPPALQFEQSYAVEKGEVLEDKSLRKATLQIPSQYTYDAVAGAIYDPKCILAIDPGGYGFGLALIDLESGKTKDSGYIHVNSLIKYVNAKNEHRQITTPKQQYKAKFSSHLRSKQDGAIGDISHIIDRLMFEFDAFPVFESMGNSSMPETNVWNGLISRYCFGDNDAQNTLRKTHWCGAMKFDTRWMRRLPGEKKSKPLLLGPGARISSFENSQLCSKCGRNPISAIRDTIDESKGGVTIANGSMNVSCGTMDLLVPEAESIAQRRKQNKGPIYIPPANKTYPPKMKSNSRDAKELLNTVFRSIRRSAENKSPKMSIDSQYHCAFTDCKNIMNADANAAVNAGMKLFNQLSQEALD